MRIFILCLYYIIKNEEKLHEELLEFLSNMIIPALEKINSLSYFCNTKLFTLHSVIKRLPRTSEKLPRNIRYFILAHFCMKYIMKEDDSVQISQENLDFMKKHFTFGDFQAFCMNIYVKFY